MYRYVYMCFDSVVKNPPACAGDTDLIPGSGRSLEKEMVIHSSPFAWRMTWTKDPGPWGHKRVGHN